MFLWTEGKFMPEMHLRWFYIQCLWTIYKKQRKNKKSKGTGYIYQNQLDKTGFQHDMAYCDFNDLTQRITSDKILVDKAFNITKHPKYDGYEHAPVSMAYKFFDKTASGGTVKNENISNQRIS